MSISAYPLQWPAGRARELPKRFGSFSKGGSTLTVSVALDRLHRQLFLLGAKNVVVSTNIPLRADGLPRSGQGEPGDPAVAVYFQLDGKSTCLPCQTYKKVAQNLAAIAAHIEATRAIERHGVATVAEMFRGFVQLPAPREWWDILECRKDASREAIEAAYRRLAKDRHPDRGGSQAAMAELNAARDKALKEIIRA